MKWFQHFSDSHTNGKHRQLIKKYGMEGYGLFWLCDELVGKEGHNLALKEKDDWKGMLEDISHLKKDLILEMVQFMAEMNLISKKSLSKGILAIPKLAKYSDDYSRRRIRTPSEQSPNNVRLHNTTLQDNTTHIAFEKFWSLYPKKIAKQKSSLAFKRIPESEYELIFAHIQKSAQSDQWRKEGGQFIPNPTTYLNQERWKSKITLPIPKKASEMTQQEMRTAWQ